MPGSLSDGGERHDPDFAEDFAEGGDAMTEGQREELERAEAEIQHEQERAELEAQEAQTSGRDFDAEIEASIQAAQAAADEQTKQLAAEDKTDSAGAQDKPQDGKQDGGGIDLLKPFWTVIHKPAVRVYTEYFQGEGAENDARTFAAEKATSSGHPVAVLGPQAAVYAIPEEIKARPMPLDWMGE